MNTVLDALSIRHAPWMSPPTSPADSTLDQASRSSGDTSDEDPSLVRAMPVILRMERADLPRRTPLLEAAAAAALAVCLDPRAGEGGEWHEEVHAWVAGRVRKVARRARGAHWQAVGRLPGRTVTVEGAQARALVPGLVTDTPREVVRLQISGSDLPADVPGVVPTGMPVLWLNPVVPMTAGKAAAQVGHASMLLAALLHASRESSALETWAANDFRCAVRTPSRQLWAALHPGDEPAAAWRARQVVAVHDAGLTEVVPGTVTVLAQAPRAVGR